MAAVVELKLFCAVLAVTVVRLLADMVVEGLLRWWWLLMIVGC